MRLIQGDREGRHGQIRLGCCAAIFDYAGRILLTQRADNQQWCLPAGAVNPGESVSETIHRETLEETGLHVRVDALIGVYSNPHTLVQYADGNRYQIVSLLFAASTFGSKLQTLQTRTDETLDAGYYNERQTAALNVLEPHRQRIHDAYRFTDRMFVTDAANIR